MVCKTEVSQKYWVDVAEKGKVGNIAAKDGYGVEATNARTSDGAAEWDGSSP